MLQGPGYTHDHTHDGHDHREDDSTHTVIRECVEDFGSSQDVEPDEQNIIR